MTILNIFCMLIDALVELKISGAFMACAYLFACFVISSCSWSGSSTKTSYLVPTRNGIAVLLNPRACLYQSLIEFNVDFRERSNMNKTATASVATSGSMLVNSASPPKSQMEKVISVFLMLIVRSMKFTPSV